MFLLSVLKLVILLNADWWEDLFLVSQGSCGELCSLEVGTFLF